MATLSGGSGQGSNYTLGRGAIAGNVLEAPTNCLMEVLISFLPQPVSKISNETFCISFRPGVQQGWTRLICWVEAITGQYGGKLCHEISPWCGMVLVLELELVLDLVSENLC